MKRESEENWRKGGRKKKGTDERDRKKRGKVRQYRKG